VSGWFGGIFSGIELTAIGGFFCVAGAAGVFIEGVGEVCPMARLRVKPRINGAKSNFIAQA
jgi:hypothetical protein